MGIQRITLDATGTLFRPRRTIGDVYMEHFRATMPSMGSFLVDDDAAISSKAFGHAFKKHMEASPNFGAATALSAKGWWGRVIVDTFPDEMKRHMLAHPTQTETLVDALYAHYARGHAWEVFPDVRPALHALAKARVPVGVISNFDDRLETILRDLDLLDALDFVVTSYAHGEMKPRPSIFHVATSTWTCPTDAVLHVGDDAVNDYAGATAAGFHARLLCRDPTKKEGGAPLPHRIASLLDIVQTLNIKY
ncbi:Aste57867_16061 [Aphanomyces stellatus]|uniref:Aste57867_16061 protein n=1 Tax=Aphanomyces stellatus TaxID=120398 RepID=A0A485L5K1_9STRA|nr:hypothetical protein As57867_016005 [Aphanomyces stellatus]VFT92845.1 Aste57867_16061 [Aphanomyces stellatus]